MLFCQFGAFAQIQQQLKLAVKCSQYQNCWISDKAWIEILEQYYNLKANI